MSSRALLLGLTAGAAYVALAAGYLGDNPGSGGDIQGDEVSDGEAPTIIDNITNMATNAVSNPTSMSPAGLAMLMQLEGFSATPYADYKGQSIGFGHLIKAGESYSSISQEQGAELLRSDVAWAERAVMASVSARLTQEQFDALVSLCYNIGDRAFRRSTLVSLLNQGDYGGAAEQFSRWVYAGGAVNGTLIARRAQETALFAGGTAT